MATHMVAGAGSDEARSIARDWQNREFIENLQQSILQMITFLNEFDTSVRYRLAKVNEQLTGLERYLDFLEASIGGALPDAEQFKPIEVPPVVNVMADKPDPVCASKHRPVAAPAVQPQVERQMTSPRAPVVVANGPSPRGPVTAARGRGRGRGGAVRGGRGGAVVAQPGPPAQANQNITRFGPGDAISMETLTPGDGKTFPGPQSHVMVHYRGYLQNGQIFDESQTDYSMHIGSNQVVLGLEMTLQKMSVGQVVRVDIPSEFAYGTAGAGDVIPPNNDLRFDLVLTGVVS
eukprot:156736_1